VRDWGLCVRESNYLSEAGNFQVQDLHRIQRKGPQVLHGIRAKDGRGRGCQAAGTALAHCRRSIERCERNVKTEEGVRNARNK